MGVFDIFSTDDQTKAAQDLAAGYTQGYGQLSDLFNQGRGALTSSYGTGANAVTGAVGNANNTLGTNYAAALKPLTNVQNTNTAGLDQLSSLLGFGPQGSAGIQTTLQNLPGYQFALNQGTQNVMRNEAATGQLDSGATDTAIANYTTGLANQNYTNYLSQLQPFLTAANSGASNIAGVNQNLGNATSGNFMTGGNLLNTNAMNLGNNLNTSFTNQGNAAYGTQAAIGNANAQADLAGLTQSGNILGAITGFLSDRDAKEDIEKVGELFDGQTVWRYRYKGDDRHQIGLIAQEVEESTPSAVIHNFAGSPLKGVDYKRATNWAAELGHMLEAA
jgi:hypothetical protein